MLSSHLFLCLPCLLPLSLCLARWFWPDLMNGKHDHTTAVCVFLRSSGDLLWGKTVWQTILLITCFHASLFFSLMGTTRRYCRVLHTVILRLLAFQLRLLGQQEFVYVFRLIYTIFWYISKIIYGESMTSLILSLINKLNTVFDQASLILLSLITKLDTVFDQQAWYCLWSSKLDTVFDQQA